MQCNFTKSAAWSPQLPVGLSLSPGGIPCAAAAAAAAFPLRQPRSDIHPAHHARRCPATTRMAWVEHPQPLPFAFSPPKPPASNPLAHSTSSPRPPPAAGHCGHLLGQAGAHGSDPTTEGDWLRPSPVQQPTYLAWHSISSCGKPLCLPISLGGLGLTDPTMEAAPGPAPAPAPAYLASTSKALHLLLSLPPVPTRLSIGGRHTPAASLSVPSRHHPGFCTPAASVTIRTSKSWLPESTRHTLSAERESRSPPTDLQGAGSFAAHWCCACGAIPRAVCSLSTEVHAHLAGALLEDSRSIQSAPDTGHPLRLISVQREGAGRRLAPSPPTDLSLSAGQFRSAPAFRLGIRIQVPTVRRL
ncbi:unnamed protein product [Closterium sp. NIES-54]